MVALGDDRSRKFATELSGFAESPPADSDADGEAKLVLKPRDRLDVKLKVRNLYGAVAAHIHLGEPGINGPVVATLLSAGDSHGNHGRPRGELEIEITLDERDLDGGPFAGDFPGFVSALRDGALYVNVHTTTYPGGEVRGQIGVAERSRHDVWSPDDSTTAQVR